MTEVSSNRLRLVQRWQERLAECEAVAGEERSTFNWLWRVKGRIYRFLLSRYGAGDWRSDSGESAGEAGLQEMSRQPLVVREPLPEMASGPKSEERIHTTLGTVHESVPQVAQGFYRYQRPIEEPWYPAGRVHRDEHGLRRAIERVLEREGIAYKWEKTPVSFFLRVHDEHKEHARELLEAMKLEMPRKTRSVRPKLKFLFALLVLCVLLGLILNAIYAVH